MGTSITIPQPISNPHEKARAERLKKLFPDHAIENDVDLYNVACAAEKKHPGENRFQRRKQRRAANYNGYGLPKGSLRRDYSSH